MNATINEVASDDTRPHRVCKELPVQSAEAKAGTDPRHGPLAGVRIIEFAGIGPGPFAAMLLADMGADIVRIDRPGGSDPYSGGMVGRGRRTVVLDLKQPESTSAALDLIEHADALIEGFRPGVMERLGLGPEVALCRNPRLVYGRMTGWGQTGPLARAAGHDINYIAITGALAAIGPRGLPVPPLNLVGDYGGGALYLVMGVLAALLSAKGNGRGQVVDAAICDGVASLMTMVHELGARGEWKVERQSNLLDGGAPYYRTFECRDGRHVAVGAIETEFYELLCAKIGLVAEDIDPRENADAWPSLNARLEALFKTRARDEWSNLLEGSDACLAPVLSISEALSHPHLAARTTYVVSNGATQPGPAPRFSATTSHIAPPSIQVSLGEAAAVWRNCRTEAP